jgi:hypothetical protein
MENRNKEWIYWQTDIKVKSRMKQNIFNNNFKEIYLHNPEIMLHTHYFKCYAREFKNTFLIHNIFLFLNCGKSSAFPVYSYRFCYPKADNRIGFYLYKFKYQ